MRAELYNWIKFDGENKTGILHCRIRKKQIELTEKKLTIEQVNPARFFGTDNATIKYLKTKFPEIKINSRGNVITVRGESRFIQQFEEKLNLMQEHLVRHPRLDEIDIDEILKTSLPPEGNEQDQTPAGKVSDQVLVYGPNGKVIKVRTRNQEKLVDAIEHNDIVFVIGPAGTGKTYTAVALAVRALKNKEIKRIILARPAVEAGENLGFLPGDLKEKIDPYLKPLYDSLHDMIPHEKFNTLMETGAIEIVPMAFMRGRTLDNCFVLLDEAQNATQTQLKMFLTRMGPNAKVIITGDLSQIDLPKNQNSGLRNAIKLLQKIKGIKVVELDATDVIRHKLVKDIIKAYDMEQFKSNKPAENKEGDLPLNDPE